MKIFAAILVLLSAVAASTRAFALTSPPGMIPNGPPIESALRIQENDSRPWRIQASTGWDSLYMDRGVNVLGNGNGLYWIALEAPIEIWESGTVTPGVWYGIGSHWNRAQLRQLFKELLVSCDFTQAFGNLSISTGWEFTCAPVEFELQNEIFVALSYDWTIGPATVTPNTAWHYNLGPKAGTPGGAVNGGASYLTLGLEAEIPLANCGAVALAPWTSLGINFNYNERGGDPLLGIDGEPFIGGNNIEFGIALPLRLSSWFMLEPYAAFSRQWQNLGAGSGSRSGFTDPDTWWTGVRAALVF
jgi:hypothetical protein